MKEYIKVNGTEYPATTLYINKDRNWGDREVRRVYLNMPYAEAAALLPSGTPWSVVIRETAAEYDGSGNPTGQTTDYDTEEDMSAYSLSGEIVDHRDGTVSIKMGKPTESELSAATVTALVGQSITPQRAAKLRPMIEAATTSLPDGEAAAAVEMFPNWSEHIGEAVIPGQRMSDTDDNGVLRLYKVREGKGHTTQADWAPHLTPAMWVVVDVAHAGTQEDPIPASRGMEYEYGKYYLDGEDSKIYLCQRIGEAAGGTIVLQYMPHELVGNYFTAVNM